MGPCRLGGGTHRPAPAVLARQRLEQGLLGLVDDGAVHGRGLSVEQAGIRADPILPFGAVCQRADIDKIQPRLAVGQEAALADGSGREADDVLIGWKAARSSYVAPSCMEKPWVSHPRTRCRPSRRPSGDSASRSCPCSRRGPRPPEATRRRRRPRVRAERRVTVNVWWKAERRVMLCSTV